MSCPHCYAADWFKDHTQLTFDEVQNVVLQAKKLGCKKVTLTGGEPLVSLYICDSIKFCLFHKLKVSLETNGVLVGKLIPTLSTSDIKNVNFTVSYDGEIMRDSKFSFKVKENIEKLVNLGCSVKIQTTITRLNINELDIILSFSKNLGIPNRVFLSHSPNGNAKDLKLLDVEDWLKTIKYIKSNYDHAIVELPDVFSGKASRKCGWGVHRCEIMSNGDITSCGPIAFNKRGFVAGNIKDNSLGKIWNSEHFSYIHNLKQNDFKGLCAKCMFWKDCLGACRSVSYANGDNLLDPHPFCNLVYNAVKNSELDDSELFDAQRTHEWIRQIDSLNFVPESELYSSIVKEQHSV
jgi:radical SAM protein with 4Fe4S-binding SPASM domain